MQQISETPLQYQDGEERYIGLLLSSADQAATAAVVLLPDWRGGERSWRSTMLGILCNKVAWWLLPIFTEKASAPATPIKLDRWSSGCWTTEARG